MIRIIAGLLLFIPGIIAAIGIKLMRDALFDEFYSLFFHVFIQFAFGFMLFLGGLVFIGGFIVYRDRKKQKSQRRTKRRHK